MAGLLDMVPNEVIKAGGTERVEMADNKRRPVDIVPTSS